MNKLLAFFTCIVFGFFWSCNDTDRVSVEDWGKIADGNVQLYTLRNQTGMTVKISNYGGIITHLTAPDRHGAFDDVVLGYDKLDDYLKVSPYFGALIGRYGNRIAKGKFTLNDSTYNLAVNNGPNHLHGGLKSFDKVLWKTEVLATDVPSIRLSYHSLDGEEGYPGNLKVVVTYTLTHSNELKIDYEASTDKATVVNLTNHSYFNLNFTSENILDHTLFINADSLVAIDSTLIPTKIIAVGGGPLDFGTKKKISKNIKDYHDEQIKYGGGYDHCYVVNKPKGDYRYVASVEEAFSGRRMEVLSTEPGVQLYTGNFLDGKIKGKGGKVYGKHAGFCLETQHYPDSPNRPDFPSVRLDPGKTYTSSTIYRFSFVK
jgi:aldose 1-epimerase